MNSNRNMPRNIKLMKSKHKEKKKINEAKEKQKITDHSERKLIRKHKL